ncbi:MAG: Gfo/Idh/MocA family oxidoreductase [Alphaproteobacteria bacterium]|nr:MAG: Gfo/Idh/MocA family oxidoreductase [Alphaproteobacteria bacterium]TMK04509.1 MAG: Gfo/Idh/MocA family oxidoreductase [Alphaproteobacteria bacterium]
MQIRAAIVGLGRWGRALVISMQGKSAELCFVRGHTRTRASAQNFCRAHGIPLVDSYEQILADPEIDAVVLATPHSLHESQIVAAAAAGKHIHVEKPITLDRATADRAIAAARNAGVVLAVGYCRRFHPSVVEVRQRLAQGWLGRVVAMVAQHTTSTAQFIAPDNWRAAPEEAPGGALTAVGVHALDHMIEFAGRVRDVRCVTARTIPGPSDDTTTVMLRFESGATGLIFCSVATATNFSFTLYGSKGLAEISRPNLEALRFVSTSDAPPTGAVLAPPDERHEHAGFDMLSAELTAFARAIRERKPYPVPIEDVLHGMSVFDALVQAARSNQIVKVG